MKVIYHRGSVDQATGAHEVSLKELFSTSDFVSLHCPLRHDNQKFVNAELLAMMKPTSFLINTSRGQLIDESALADALKGNKIAGAALDVLSQEPPAETNPLIRLPNCLITPHTAWLSKEARSRILETSLQNIKLALAGNPQNLVS